MEYIHYLIINARVTFLCDHRIGRWWQWSYHTVEQKSGDEGDHQDTLAIDTGDAISASLLTDVYDKIAALSPLYDADNEDDCGDEFTSRLQNDATLNVPALPSNTSYC